MKLIFSFDTEDFVTPEAMEAQKWWAEELSARGVRGCFQCVGELVRAWHENGRTDIIDAVSEHEVDYHTNYHSLHPTHPEALNPLDLADGIRWVFQREASGMAAVVETFGRMPVSYCPAGDSWTAPTLLAMAEMGVRVFCAPSITMQQQPYWYCGLLVAPYDMGFETFMTTPDGVDEFQQTFRRIRKETGDTLVVIYTHPCRLVTEKFWDFSLYKGNAPVPVPPAPLRSKAEVRTIKDRMRTLLDWVLAEPDVTTSTFGELYQEHADPRYDLNTLLAECGLGPGQAGQLPQKGPDDKCAEIYPKLKDRTYNWSLYPDGFTGKNLREQLAGLAWTYAACD